LYLFLSLHRGCSPNALGIICGILYLVFVICTQLVYAKAYPQMVGVM